MSNDKIKILKRRAWSAVPDDILQDKRMSLKARAVLAWIVGRHPDWVLYIRQMQHLLGMTETMWKSIRNELEDAGYYKQQRVQLANGKIHWEKCIADVSEQPSPGLPPMAKTTDGETRDGSTAHGVTTGGQVGDIPPIENQKELPPPPTSSRKPSSSKSTRQPVVADMDDLVEAAYWQATRADKLILNPSAWRASVRKRLQEDGPSREDRLCLEEWRASLKAKERRQAEEAERVAKAAPVADREVARQHLRNLRRPSVVSGQFTDNSETTAIPHQDDGETQQ